MTENKKYWIALTASLVFAYLGSKVPSYRMPLDYDAMISRSIPFAIAWAVILAFCLWRYEKRGLWLLVGAPIALPSGCYSIISRPAITCTIAYRLELRLYRIGGSELAILFALDREQFDLEDERGVGADGAAWGAWAVG
jgi:hypothetical protein